MTDTTASAKAVSVVFEWWRGLNPKDSVPSGRQRGASARLRRAATPLEVIQEPDALRLIARLPQRPERIAILAGVLAFVRETETQRVARAVGRTGLDEDKSALLSENRFRRLLQVPDGDLMEPMRRLVRMTKGTLNVHDLSRSILYWNDEVKKRWIFDYYGVGAAADGGAAGSPTPDRIEEQEIDNV